MPQPHHAEKIDTEGLQDESLLGTWRELAVMRANPFLTPEWFATATDLMGEDEPHAIAWRVGGELRGILPLVSARRGPLRLLRFANARRGDWFGAACRPQEEVAMAADCGRLLAAEAGSWDALVLNRINGDSAWPAALGLRTAPRVRTDALPYIAFGDRGYGGYLAERSRNFRSQLGRRRRRLERDHGLSFRMTLRPEELEADLTTFFRLHDERWRRRGGSTLGTDRSRRLLAAFARAAQRQGWLRLWIAEADGEPAAAWYGWRIGERYCYSLAGLAMGYEKHGLGNVMLAHTIEHAAAEGAAVYDLMWGTEAYKERFQTGVREAGSWFLPSGPLSAVAVGAAVRGIHGLESLPPGARAPLRRLKRSLQRT